MPCNRKKMGILIFLILSILFVYWQVQGFQFLDYDDQIYVSGNWHIQSGLTWEGMKWAFTSTDYGFWHPLTWVSLLMDYQCYDLKPAGYHWTNVLLHMATTVLLFLVLHGITGTLWRSGFAAALFAVHPLHVESVAWIAERKDVLSAFFWMLTMGAYVYYAKHPRLGRYLWVLLFYILGMMAKPMLVTLPFVLLLIDYWPLNRFPVGQSHMYLSNAGDKPDIHVNETGIKCLILEKIPLLLIAVSASCLVYVTQQRFNALASLESFPLDSRIANAVVSYAAYLTETILPLGLAAFYPHPGSWPLPTVILSGGLLLLISAFALGYARRFPYLAVGWLWYLGVLVPVIGLIQIGSAAMADRFTYIPLIGIFVVSVWGCADLLKNRKHLFLTSMVAVIAILSILSWFQVRYWHDSMTLFQRAAQVTRNNYKALHILGLAYHRIGDDSKAAVFINESIRIKPDDSRAHNDLGIIYMAQGKFGDAQNEFTMALKLRPDNLTALNNLGAAVASQGKAAKALHYFQEVLRLDPNNGSARANLEKARQSARQSEHQAAHQGQVSKTENQ